MGGMHHWGLWGKFCKRFGKIPIAMTKLALEADLPIIQNLEMAPTYKRELQGFKKAILEVDLNANLHTGNLIPF
jgi:hypothetical protein